MYGKHQQLYTSAGKYNDQLQFKSIIEASIVSTPERFTDSSTMSLRPPIIFTNPSARKSLYLFTEFLDVKKKAAVLRVGAYKSKSKAIRSGGMLWSSIPKSKINKKLNKQVKKSPYNWILQHPQVVQSPIAND